MNNRKTYPQINVKIQILVNVVDFSYMAQRYKIESV